MSLFSPWYYFSSLDNIWYITLLSYREMIVQTGTGKHTLSEDKVHFYMDILGADLPKPSPELSLDQESSEGIHMKGLILTCTILFQRFFLCDMI